MAPNGSAAAAEEPKLNFLQKIWTYMKYLVVEQFFFFYLLAIVFNENAMESYPLDKVCRVNLGYNKLVCDTSLDKGDIDCDDFDFENTTQGAAPDLLNLSMSSMDFNYTVCKAEQEAGLLIGDLLGSKVPIVSIIPLILLLFAGSWSDRYNKRKACMILPIVGGALSSLGLMVSAIFFDSVPIHFDDYCNNLLSVLFGGNAFCLMAIYSYLAITTLEEDRFNRYCIFTVFLSAVPPIGEPIVEYLSEQFGYALSFGVAACFQIIAILLIIFTVTEVKVAPEAEEKRPPPELASPENLEYEVTNLDDIHLKRYVSFEIARAADHSRTEPAVPVRRGFCCRLLDPTLVWDCIKLPLIKRNNNGRILMMLLILSLFLMSGPDTGEDDNDFYLHTLLFMDWDDNDLSSFLTIRSAAFLVGTFIGFAILSRTFKLADSAIGIFAALAVAVSRIIFAFSEDTIPFYVAVAFDMFAYLPDVVIRTIGSSIVSSKEVGKMFSILAISELIGAIIFQPIYRGFYGHSDFSHYGSIFLFGELFFVPNVIVFIICYFILRRNKRNSEKPLENAQNSQAITDAEVTSL